MNIKKGDQVKILTGKDRGKTGPIVRVFPEEGKLVVEGVNMYKKRVRPKKQGEKGEVVTLARPIRISNVAILCGNCKKTTRVGTRTEGEEKSRYCKKCSAAL